MVKNCLICNKEYYKSKNCSQSKWKIRKCCSDKCKSLYLSQLFTKPKKEKNCLTCTKKFFPDSSNTARNGGKYCSHKCFSERNGQRVKRICLKCKKELLCIPWDATHNRDKYCSKICYFKRNGERIKVNCGTCKKPLDFKPSQIKYGYGKYCSKLCYFKDFPNIFNGKPNKPEYLVEQYLNQNYPNEWKYTGNGDTWIGKKNPDFVNINGQKKLIEVYGNYWHRNDNPQDRIDHFKQYGFDTLVLWEKEIKTKEYVSRIKNFVVNTT